MPPKALGALEALAVAVLAAVILEFIPVWLAHRRRKYEHELIEGKHHTHLPPSYSRTNVDLLRERIVRMTKRRR